MRLPFSRPFAPHYVVTVTMKSGARERFRATAVSWESDRFGTTFRWTPVGWWHRNPIRITLEEIAAVFARRAWI